MTERHGGAAVAERTNPRLVAYAMLAGMVLVWSLNWVVVKTAVADTPPLWFTAFRFIGAAVVTSALCMWLNQPLAPRGSEERRRLAIVGLFSMAGNLTCLAIGLQYANAGRGAVLAYTMQMWAIPLGYYINSDRISMAKIVFGALALGGTLLLVDLQRGLGAASAEFGYLVLACAAINWAIGSCLYRRFTWTVPFWTQINVQLWASAAAVLVAALLFNDARQIKLSSAVTSGLVYNWVLGTGLCYWWWSKVLRVMSAAQGGLVLCAIPLVAIAFSMIVFGERLSGSDLVGIALILTGITGALIGDLRAPKV